MTAPLQNLKHISPRLGENEGQLYIDIMEYIPKPVDTSDIELSGEMKELTEDMAKNVHEVWSLTRLNDGWKYGPERNDALKTHPCLVPYDELPESEKEYDRNTSQETLKLILKLGFRIIRNS